MICIDTLHFNYNTSVKNDYIITTSLFKRIVLYVCFVLTDVEQALVVTVVVVVAIVVVLMNCKSTQLK